MLLSAIGYREIPIPEHIDIYHLTREMAPSDKTALQCVMDVDEERIKLEKETERLAHEDCESRVTFLCEWKCSKKPKWSEKDSSLSAAESKGMNSE